MLGCGQLSGQLTAGKDGAAAQAVSTRCGGQLQAPLTESVPSVSGRLCGGLMRGCWEGLGCSACSAHAPRKHSA